MPHLNEDMLIQYRFDLLEADQRLAVEHHLADCADCRQKLEQLENRYSSLDTLGDEIPPSEELIQKTLQSSQAKKRLLTPLFVWKRAGWTAAAAAVILVGVMLIQNRPGKIVKEENVAARKVVQAPSALELKQKATDRLLTVSEKPAMMMEALRDMEHGVKAVPADQIPDTPPFVPASAIELVVLPRPDKTQLTIYNSADLTLVRDTRKLTLKAGWNWLQFMWSGTLIDPTSLSIRPLQYADKIETEQLVYPARLRQIGRWLIRSEVEGAVSFEITYFTSGLSWRAFYMGTMDQGEDKMNLCGYVRVQNNSGKDYENARTRLIVGQVHLLDEIAQLARRQYPYGPEFEERDKFGIESNEKPPILGRLFSARSGGLGGDIEDELIDRKKIVKEGLSEYFLYTIEGTETIPDQWAKRLPSLDIENIPIESLYKYDEDRYGVETIQFVSFANDQEHQLGQTPLPDGSVRIFHRLNEEGDLSYIGGCDVKYIPVNEQVELNLGPSRLVKVRPKLMETRTDHYTFNSKGDIDGYDQIETWTIEIINTRPIPAKVEITRNFNADSWDLKPLDTDGIEYRKHDVTRARFTATLSPRAKKEFTVLVTRYNGKRRQFYEGEQK